MSDETSRELTPADIRVLEPDLLGALAIALYGRTEESTGLSAPSAPTGWRGRVWRAGFQSRPGPDGRAG